MQIVSERKIQRKYFSFLYFLIERKDSTDVIKHVAITKAAVIFGNGITWLYKNIEKTMLIISEEMPTKINELF
ncbi:MAG: hypothetical protein HUJ68_13100 [Clostridia bacterium]|nr:hypothetical protein [Clostridia bacterium]